MELQYVKELEKHSLQVKDLPEDARTGIREINKALSFIKMGEAKGKKTSPDAIKKIKAMDKWVLYEIYDLLRGEDDNDDEIPYESEDVQDDLKNDNEEYYEEDLDDDDEQDKTSKLTTNVDGNKINLELTELFQTGKTEFTINEIKSSSPTIYKAIFDIYEKGEENGVETNNYSLLEFEEQKYKLTKI
tara:strand:- start:1959 stop:2522 length:564 start_codon:yes stop_codon:yes gene_type:complete